MEWITNLKPEVILNGGLTLVCLSLISALVILMKVIMKIVGNHINHTNDYINKNTEVVTKVCDCLEKNTDFTKEAINLIREIKK